MRKLFLLFLTAITFFSCSEKNPIDDDWRLYKGGIFVLNEGLYGRNNSELSFYDFDTKVVTPNLFEKANNRSLGDNANSMFIFNSKGYIAVDASNKIEVITLDGKSYGLLDLGPQASPREIFILDGNRGFVTSFSKNSVIEFDPKSLTITREIPVGKFPEGIIYKDSKLFVANSNLGKGSTISVIDIISNSVIKTIDVGINPRSIQLSNDGKVVVGCSGDFFDSNAISGFYFIDPSTLTLVDSIKLKYHPQDFVINKNNSLFFINDLGVGRINLTSKLVDTVFIQGMQINDIYGIPYALTFDELNQTLYVSNPKDFTQNGEVKSFDTSGSFISKFDVKLNPGGIYIHR